MYLSPRIKSYDLGGHRPIYVSTAFARWQHHEMRSGLSIANVDTAAGGGEGAKISRLKLLVLGELIES